MSAPRPEVVTIRRWALALPGGRSLVVRSLDDAEGRTRTVWLGLGWSEDREAPISTEGGVAVPGDVVPGLVEILEALS